MKSKLCHFLEEGKFVFTVEIQPPKGGDLQGLKEKIEMVRDFAVAVNFTDCSTARVALSSFGASLFAISLGVEPVFQITCRDRNRIAIQSDLLSAWALGIKNVLCMTGDHPTLGDHREAKPVFDLDSIQLISLVKGLNEAVFLNGKPVKKGKTGFFIGCVENPFSGDIYMRVLRLKKKAIAGARFVQTQGIYNLKKFEKFIELFKKEGLDKELYLIPGIIPPKSFKMLEYMKKNVPGIDIPENLLDRMKKASDQKKEGFKIALEIGRELKNFPEVRGLHIMTIGWEDIFKKLVEALS